MTVSILKNVSLAEVVPMIFEEDNGVVAVVAFTVAVVPVEFEADNRVVPVVAFVKAVAVDVVFV